MSGASRNWGGATNLVLDEKLDTLNGSSSGLRDGGGDTTHYRLGVSYLVRPSFLDLIAPSLIIVTEDARY
jgi:hypothetical protein